MAITADEAKRYAAVAGDALTAERVALRRTEAERDAARRLAVQAETLRGEAVERAQCYIEERDAALAQVEALARAGMLAASALDGLLGDSDLPEDNRPGVLALRALIAALSSHPAPAVYTRELAQAACMDVWDDEVGTRRVLAALDAHPEEEKP